MHDGHTHNEHQAHDPRFFHSLIPILYVSNFAVSMEYYVNKLGFEKRWDWGTPPTFGCVGRGNIEIFFCEGGQGQPGTWMSVFMNDVDALYEEYKKSGAVIAQPPMDFSWGVREMHVTDPDGHCFRMGSEVRQQGNPQDEHFHSPEP